MKYLLCVDGSPDAGLAIEHLRRLVKENDEVYIIHAWQPLALPPSVQMIGPLPIVTQSFPQYPYLYLKERKFLEHESHHILTEAAKQFVHEAHVSEEHIFTVCREAKDPKDAIIEEASKRGIDLIVMGRRGLSPIKQMVLGSNSMYIVENAHCPVMIVQAHPLATKAPAPTPPTPVAGNPTKG